MVKALHAAGLEVILDVVYNHTAEGNHPRPHRRLPRHRQPGLLPPRRRQPSPVRRRHRHRQHVNVRNPATLRLVMDSLRYWVQEMHVDGFRFDLAPALAREIMDVDREGSFFDAIHQDPVLAEVKLIAEPWDVGEAATSVGRFPSGWSEWNGKYRDDVRHFWRGDDGWVADMGYPPHRLVRSLQADGRQPYNSVNFITAHDGFTLHDLVSYEQKHNWANGEENLDGSDHNISSNYGHEGPTDDPDHPGHPRPPAAQLPGHPLPFPGHADAPRRR